NQIKVDDTIIIGEIVDDGYAKELEWTVFSLLLLFFVAMIFTIILAGRLLGQHKINEQNRYRDSVTEFLNLSGVAQKYKQHINYRSRPMYAIVAYEGNPEFLQQFYKAEETTLVLKMMSQVVSENTTKYDYNARVNQYTFCTIKQYFAEQDLIAWTQNLAQRMVEESEKLKKIQTIRPNFGIYFLKHADDDFELALYNAMQTKEYAQRKDLVYAICKSEVLDETAEFAKLEQEAIRGLVKHEFIPFYQPIVDINTGHIVSMEALARWDNKKRGILMPAKFVPHLEKNRMISKLDFQIFEEVCKWVGERAAHGKKLTVVSCNFSRLDLKQKDFSKKIKAVIEKYNCPSEYIAIEITETAMIRADNETINQLIELKKMNFKIYIDDFGAGYTSFKDFCEYPIDAIKIDKSLVDHIEDEKWCTIISGIARMAHELGYMVVCEGIETTGQVNALKATGCDVVQGHYYFHAMSQEEIEKKLD
ncbi:MAG: EAL domain-containing protein, partial [Eubacterium sp.]